MKETGRERSEREEKEERKCRERERDSIFSLGFTEFGPSVFARS